MENYDHIGHSQMKSSVTSELTKGYTFNRNNSQFNLKKNLFKLKWLITHGIKCFFFIIIYCISLVFCNKHNFYRRHQLMLQRYKLYIYF